MVVALSVLPVVAVATPAGASHKADRETVTVEWQDALHNAIAEVLVQAQSEHCRNLIQQQSGESNYRAQWAKDERRFNHERGFRTFTKIVVGKDAEGDDCTVELRVEETRIESERAGIYFWRIDSMTVDVTHREKFVGRSGEGTGNTPSELTVLPVTRTWRCADHGGCPEDASLVRGVNPCAPEAYEITRHAGTGKSANIHRPPDRDGMSEPPTVQEGSVRTAWREWHFDQCTIRVEQRQRYDSTFQWDIWEASVTHRFRPSGDVRAQCSPSFYERYPHLCTSIYDADTRRTTDLFWNPDTRQYVPYGDDRLPAPQKCNDCDDPGGGDSPGGDDPPGDDPPGGDDNGGGVGGSVGEPLQLPIPEPEHRETPAQKGDRLIENMKRYDESCKVDPALVCGDYPFHEWVS